ncbi:hypothetical protein LTS10_010829 [Elasticomyces elasticus]|nr:hypothetical protein LTS10_010829 [Elasticomyces elasticus]
MAPTLVSIPPELLEKVAKSLNPEDDASYALLALRSVCHDTRSAVEKLFVRTYFTKRCIFFMRSKLRELEDIASAKLASSVTELDIIYAPSTTKTPDWGATVEDTARQPDFTALVSPLSALLTKFPRLSTINFRVEYPTKPNNDQCQTYEWDLDATFQATMAALKMAGIQPPTIKTDMWWSSISKDQSWLCLRPHLGLLHKLDFSLFLNTEHGVKFGPPRETLCVEKVGIDFLLALQHCIVLEELSLKLGHSFEVGDAFECLASTVLLPQLRRFSFNLTACDTPSMMRFLDNHAATLKRCDFAYVDFLRRDAVEFTDLLNMMRENMRLEQLALYECSEGESPMRFPYMIKVSFDSEPNDDGYIVVELDETISLEGYDEVQSGLACMLKCVEVL